MFIGTLFLTCRREDYTGVSFECKKCLNHIHTEDWKKVRDGKYTYMVCPCGKAIDIKDTSDFNVRLNNFKDQREGLK